MVLHVAVLFILHSVTDAHAHIEKLINSVGLLNEAKVFMPLCVQNRIEVQMHPWMLVETTRVTEFEYYFACTRKGVHLHSAMSPGKMIFAVLEL